MKSESTSLKQVLSAALMLTLLTGCMLLMKTDRVSAGQVYGYLLPSSSYTYLDPGEVSGWPAQAICYAKNEIYARNGRQFQSAELQGWFDMQYWYVPVYTPGQFSDSMLNVYETANVRILTDLENALGTYALDSGNYSYDVVRQYQNSGGQSQYYVDPDTYIFFDSNSRYLNESDISTLSAQELCYAKNEIYARRGYIFVSTELSDYFNAKNWYWGTVDGSAFSDTIFNTYETANISLIESKEFALVPGGYVLDQPGYTYQNIGSYSSGDWNQATDADYIFYDSSVRALTDAEVSTLSMRMLCYARNEIYARRGYIFQSQELRDYFGSKTWYHPIVPAAYFTEEIFNSVEMSNIELLKHYEYASNPNGYQLY